MRLILFWMRSVLMDTNRSRCHRQSLPGQSRVRHHASRAVHSARRQSRPVRMAVSLQNLRHHPVRDLNRSQNRGQDLLCLHTRAAVSLQSRNQSLLHHPVRDLNRIQALALANLTERSPNHTFDIPDHAAPAFSFRRFAFNELQTTPPCGSENSHRPFSSRSDRSER